jgi:hypothetical protein
MPIYLFALFLYTKIFVMIKYFTLIQKLAAFTIIFLLLIAINAYSQHSIYEVEKMEKATCKNDTTLIQNNKILCN